MALTKVKLIADGTIVQSHLNASHGITTADISEGSNLYYTDARARAAVSVSGNALSYNSSTGVITSNFEESPVFTGNITFGDSHFIGDDADDNLLIQSSANENIIINSVDDLLLRTGGTTKLIVKNGGNVGIGTTSPSTKLDIRGGSGGGSFDHATFTSVTNRGLKISTANSSEGQNGAAVIYNAQDGENYGSHAFQIGGSTKMFIKGNNVGIGTTSLTSTSGYSTLSISGTTGAQIAFQTSGAGKHYIYSTATDFDIYNGQAGNLKLFTNSTERMRIDSLGNVGIGASSPATVLDVRGSGVAFPATTGTTPSTGTRFRLASTGSATAVLDFGISTGGKSWLQVTDRTDLSIEYPFLINPNGGNVGIGTSSPGTKLEIYGNTSSGGFGVYPALTIKNDNTSGYSAVHFNQSTNQKARIEVSNSAGSMGLYTTAAANGILINASGNVGIGTTLPWLPLMLQRAGSSTSAGADVSYRLCLSNSDQTNNNYALISFTDGDNQPGSGFMGLQFTDHSNNYGALVFGTRNSNGLAERMRITSGGYLNAGAYTSTSGTYHQIATSTNSNQTIAVRSYASTPYGLSIEFPSASPNTTDNWFLACTDSTQSKLIIWSNGNVVNRNNSYGALSDVKLKENIVDATPKLDDLMKVKVRNFNLKGEETKQIGVVAQELEEVFPGMISESKDLDFDDETLYKSVKYSVFVPIMIKAMQEQQDVIKELKAEIETLKLQING